MEWFLNVLGYTFKDCVEYTINNRKNDHDSGKKESHFSLNFRLEIYDLKQSKYKIISCDVNNKKNNNINRDNE